MRAIRFAVSAALLSVASAWAAGPTDFHLQNGDRVVFYGDSITDQRLYTSLIETYVALHYPERAISFVNSGWGGDTVGGGGGGTIDTRLQRDVFAYQPTVVTIMLGMNDGGYHAENQENDQKYFTGVHHIVDTLRQQLPNSRLVLIEPSPYDEVTRSPAAPVVDGSSYNDVLRSYGKWLANYAAQSGMQSIDLNSGMQSMLVNATRLDPEGSKGIVPDHIHPSFAGHLFMAAEILKAWGAKPVVSAVALDASKPAIRIESTQSAKVSGLSGGEEIAWTELDDALPLPFAQWQGMWGAGPVSLVLRSSEITQDLNQQILKVKGLKSGTYSLKIDGSSVGAFNNEEFGAGINLAVLKTPATDQALKVYQLAVSHEEIHFDQWRNVQVALQDYSLAEVQPASAAFKSLDDAVAGKMRAAGRPVEHRFEIVPIS
jgi:lysophospholipase L1-like esterase